MENPTPKADKPDVKYNAILGDVSKIIDNARKLAARSVNAVMTAAYWLIGRHIVEFEQSSGRRGDYGDEIVERLAEDLYAHYGRGFSVRNVWNMKAFYLAWQNLQTASAELDTSGNLQTVSAESSMASIASHFPLPWSAYVRLLSVKNKVAREFYESEALQGGSTVFSSRAAMSGDHRPESWQIRACRCRPNASISQLRPRSIGCSRMRIRRLG